MASRLALAKLARAARALNARGVGARGLPPLILMTDEQRIEGAIPSALALGKGSAIILRHTDPAARAALARTLFRIARARGLMLLVAGDAELALRIGADGLHLPESHARDAAHWKARRPDWLITAAAHSARALARAASWRADAALLAPVFPTASHRHRAVIPLPRVLMAARAAPLPVYALGGVTADTVGRLRAARLAGIAAIGGLSAGHRE